MRIQSMMNNLTDTDELESEIRNCKIRNCKIRNRKIAESEIAKSETQRVRYWVNRSASDSAEGEEIENIGASIGASSGASKVRQRCVNRRVKGASIDASNICSPTSQSARLRRRNIRSPTRQSARQRCVNRRVSDAGISGSPAAQSARLRRRNIWFNRTAIGQGYRFAMVQSARQRCVKYLVLLLLNRRVIGLP